MLMEAMRLSMLEHEEEQKKQAEAKKKEEEAARQKVGSLSVGSPEPAVLRSLLTHIFHQKATTTVTQVEDTNNASSSTSVSPPATGIN